MAHDRTKKGIKVKHVKELIRSGRIIGHKWCDAWYLMPLLLI
jgi:hypothetical protein